MIWSYSLSLSYVVRSCPRSLEVLSALMRRGLVGLSAAHVVRRIRSSLQHYLAPHNSPSFWSSFVADPSTEDFDIGLTALHEFKNRFFKVNP